MDRKAKTVGFTADERNIFLHVLTACNLSCRHCYINKEQHGSGQLTKEQLGRWIELFATKAKTANLILLGGEPTLHQDLPWAIAHAKALGYAVTVDTNGYLFHDFLAKTSPECLDFLSFSLDGPTWEINDAIRGKGVFQVCSEAILKANSMGFTTSLIYTVSRRNIDYLELMPELLERLGIRRFFIQVLGLRGNSAAAKDQATSRVTRSRWLETVPGVAAQCALRGIEVVYPKVFLGPQEPFECAGRVAENFFVFPNGRVYQCPLCEDYPLHSYAIVDNELVPIKGLRENALFTLDIREGCVINKLLQPDTIEYGADGKPLFPISCCLLKEKIG